MGPLGPPVLLDHRVSSTPRAGALTVALSAPSDRVAHQTDTITLRSAGRPITATGVSVVGRSLDMDMGQSPAHARLSGPGRCTAVGDVVMGGGWQVMVTVQRGRTRSPVTFTYLAHY